MPLATIPDALEALREGRPVLVVDDADRENEGDVIVSAALATPETLAWMVRVTSGYLCAPMPRDLADRLDLPPMVAVNQDPKSTAYTVSVDAAFGVTTGISAADRARTLNVLADPDSGPADLIRPGHILPLRAVDGGVRERAGHTEAAVELVRLAGLPPVGAIGELVTDDGSMMRLPEILELGEERGLPVVTIADLIAFVSGREVHAEEVQRPRVSLRAEADMPTEHGLLRVRAYRDAVTGHDHVALIADPIPETPLVRVHSECLTGEAFGSLKCECGPQLDAAIQRIAAEGGVVVYLRGHEGRGIGLVDKLRAYRLQEDGLDTVDANTALGLPADRRDFGGAAGILADLGATRVRLMTNNPDKVEQLTEHGIEVAEMVPMLVGVREENRGYLGAKRDRLGHRFPSDEDLARLAERTEDGA
ncbi:MAG: bifunctional 3,4-dihydroxy-2-butanone 4-phosphate synthase/GTP cyclohydrolase II [Micrococcales bacterium 73-13]|nr:MAG: bifunctional 3,4-dihydroxy-2-butanone 4-phosphate synthase/GTP cyclohydrolase II [Micrococcales bacterium 73-13]